MGLERATENEPMIEAENSNPLVYDRPGTEAENSNL